MKPVGLALVLLLSGCISSAAGPLSGKSYLSTEDPRFIDECQRHYVATRAEKLTPAAREAVLAHRPLEGMNEEEVAAAVGSFNEQAQPQLPEPESTTRTAAGTTFNYHLHSSPLSLNSHLRSTWLRLEFVRGRLASWAIDEERRAE